MYTCTHGYIDLCLCPPWLTAGREVCGECQHHGHSPVEETANACLQYAHSLASGELILGALQVCLNSAKAFIALAFSPCSCLVSLLYVAVLYSSPSTPLLLLSLSPISLSFLLSLSSLPSLSLPSPSPLPSPSHLPLLSLPSTPSPSSPSPPLPSCCSCHSRSLSCRKEDRCRTYCSLHRCSAPQPSQN